MKQEKKVQENEEIVIKPKCVLEHKREMGWVDKNDKMLACFPVIWKFLKGSYIKKNTLSNVFISHSKLTKEKFKMKYTACHLNLAKQIPDPTKLQKKMVVKW
jgi:hypothetical protein